MGERVSTGIATLDRHLDGGLRPGTMLAIVAEPSTQSETLMHSIMRKRPTLYISTVRRQAAVEDALDRSGTDRDVTVEYAGTEVPLQNEFLVELTGDRSASMEFTTETAGIDDAYEAITAFDEPGTVVVDSTNPLERTDKAPAYRALLNTLKTQVTETGGVGVLHCISHEGNPGFRETTLTLADMVWELDLVSVPSGNEYRLRIPKNRGGKVINDDISLMLGRDVTVDNTQTF
jgi:KaiC/GvpD/RAD55 family RecA-like ATPase